MGLSETEPDGGSNLEAGPSCSAAASGDPETSGIWTDDALQALKMTAAPPNTSIRFSTLARLLVRNSPSTLESLKRTVTLRLCCRCWRFDWLPAGTTPVELRRLRRRRHVPASHLRLLWLAMPLRDDALAEPDVSFIVTPVAAEAHFVRDHDRVVRPAGEVVRRRARMRREFGVDVV